MHIIIIRFFFSCMAPCFNLIPSFPFPFSPPSSPSLYFPFSPFSSFPPLLFPFLEPWGGGLGSCSLALIIKKRNNLCLLLGFYSYLWRPHNDNNGAGAKSALLMRFCPGAFSGGWEKREWKRVFLVLDIVIAIEVSKMSLSPLHVSSNHPFNALLDRHTARSSP